MLSSTVQSEAAAPYNLFAMEIADVCGHYGIEGQGPYATLYANVSDGAVKRASFKTYSCPNAIACGDSCLCRRPLVIHSQRTDGSRLVSAPNGYIRVTRWMEGRSPEALRLLDAEDLRKVLGGLAVGKEQCADMIVNALRDLLKNWECLAGGRP
jgi:hypothetical protein